MDDLNKPEDVFILDWKQLIRLALQNEPLSEETIIEYEKQIERGQYCETCIINYRDYILTSINPIQNLPGDAQSEIRLPKENLKDNHSAENCHLQNINNNECYTVNYDNYSNLIQYCYRHRYTQDYCLKNGKCRFNFPQKLEKNLHYIFFEHLNKVNCKFAPTTNDKWLNSHCPLATVAWCGMADLHLIVDKQSIIH